MLKIVEGAISALLTQHAPTQEQALQAQLVEATLQATCRSVLDALGRLFPCGPGTFFSYATHNSRLGYIIHKSNCIGSIHTICNALISGTLIAQGNADIKSSNDIIALFPPLVNRTIDSKLAVVLFILDISDTADQIFNILDARHTANAIAEYQGLEAEVVNRTRNTLIAYQYNQYVHRPVSASSVIITGRSDGDCVQTLYRHLVNIAVQNQDIDARKYNVGVLPKKLNQYYAGKYFADIIVIGENSGESGIVNKNFHQEWNDALRAEVPANTNIVNGTTDNIAAVLSHVCPHNGGGTLMMQSALAEQERHYLNQDLNPLIANNAGQVENATQIQDALNALDGRCDNTEGARRFIVRINTREEVIGIATLLGVDVPTYTHIPADVASIIEIADKLWNRRIIIGVWGGGHAEIISIIP